MRLGRDAAMIANEVIAHLEGLVGSEVNITLEISAQVPEGIPGDFPGNFPSNPLPSPPFPYNLKDRRHVHLALSAGR